MKAELQDQRSKLLAELGRLDERIDMDACTSLTQEAEQHVITAKRLLAEASERDVEQKHRELAERDAIAAAKRKDLIAKIEAEERLYREGITRGLRALEISDPLYHPNEAEQRLLADPQKAPCIGLSSAFWRECPAKPSIQYISARRNLARLRSEYASLGV